MKLVLLTASMKGGGGARTIATMANSWVEFGWVANALTFDQEGVRPDYLLDPEVAIEFLDLGRDNDSETDRIVNKNERNRTMRRIATEIFPDAVTLFGDRMNVPVLISPFGTGFPVVAAERVNLARNDIGKLREAEIADLLVEQVCGLTKVPERSRISAAHWEKIVVSPNPVLAGPRWNSKVSWSRARYTIIATGRLRPQKGFDVSIKAFARVALDAPGWDLMIGGKGEERRRFEA